MRGSSGTNRGVRSAGRAGGHTQAMRRGLSRKVLAVALATSAGVAAAAGVLRSSDTAEASSSSTTTGVYVPTGPLRAADTRRADCGCVRVDATTISVSVTDRDGVPADAVAAVVTVTALPGPFGYATVYPSGMPRPTTSTVNTRPDRAVANTAIVMLGEGGGLEVFTSSPIAVVLDVVGAFVPAERATAGRFQAVAPQRLLDAREVGPASAPGSVTQVAVPETMAGAAALAVNVTHVGVGTPGHVSIASSPDTSFLNTVGHGAVAATVIAPVVDGYISFVDRAGGYLVVDVSGWFTGDDAPGSDTGLFVPLAPDRLADTRAGERIWRHGTIEVGSPVPAAALVTNVTVTRPDRAGYVSAFPAGTARPLVSAVNPVAAEHTLANLTITPISTRGLAYFASVGTDLVVDVTGYFTGQPVAATEPPAPNVYPRPRVLLIGDSGLRGVGVYSDSQAAFADFDYRLEAAGCRRLHEVSCTSPGITRAPPTGLDVINGLIAAGQRFDIVIVTAGHNDAARFELAFARIVDAARRAGAHTILWQNYSALSEYGHLNRNSALLAGLTSLPEYGDVLLADWRTYTVGTGKAWLWDGIHMTPAGAWAQTDYLARWVAFLEHRPCPAPWAPDQPVPDPCPNPDTVGPPANPRALYP